LVARVGVTTWSAAAKLGRLVLGEFWTSCTNCRVRFSSVYVLRTGLNQASRRPFAATKYIPAYVYTVCNADCKSPVADFGASVWAYSIPPREMRMAARKIRTPPRIAIAIRRSGFSIHRTVGIRMKSQKTRFVVVFYPGSLLERFHINYNNNNNNHLTAVCPGQPG